MYIFVLALKMCYNFVDKSQGHRSQQSMRVETKTMTDIYFLLDGGTIDSTDR